MASSTLDPDNIPEPDRQLGRGHGTSALGPSDISDTGSDVQGGLHAIEDADLGLDKGTNEDADSGWRASRAEPDASGTDVDSDTDSLGTGERGTIGHSQVELGADVGVDRIDALDPDDLDINDAGDLPPTRSRHPGRPQQQR